MHAAVGDTEGQRHLHRRFDRHSADYHAAAGVGTWRQNEDIKGKKRSKERINDLAKDMPSRSKQYG